MLPTCYVGAKVFWTCKGSWFGTCSKSGSLWSSMNWSFFVLIDLSSYCVVTSTSMSSSPPSIIIIHWRVWGFFFNGELIGYGLNQSLGVDDSICIFTHCEYWTSCGNMLAKHTDGCSLKNYSLVTTSREVSLNCSTKTFFFSLS